MRNAYKFLLVVALASPATALAGIASTMHDLASPGMAVNDFGDGADGQCRPCHQIHGARTSNAGLWVRTPSKEATWTSGNALEPRGTPLRAPDDQPGARSQKCLSCHDGTVARNIVAVGGGVVLRSGSTASLRDPTRRHPVGIPFAGQMGGSTATNQYGVATTTNCASRNSVCVTEAGAPGAGAYIKLFGRAGAYGVECASCHDPHQDNLAGTHPHFLRVPSTAGAESRCGGCHRR